MSSYMFSRRFILATLSALLLAGGVTVALANPPTAALRQDADATVTALLRLQQEVFLTQTAVAQQSTTPIMATSTAAAPVQTAKPSPTPAPSVVILAQRLTLRAAPGPTAAVLGLAETGQQFYVTAQAGSCAWLEIVLDDGGSGWLTGDPALVQLAVPCSAVKLVAVALAPTATALRRLPTATPTPTRVVVTATPTAPPATSTPRPAPTADLAGGPNAATILAPNDRQSSRAPTTFAWTVDAPLATGQEFEVVFWNANSESEAQARGWVRSSPQSQAVIPADKMPPGVYKWALLLVTTEPYQRLRRLAGPFTFVIPGESDASSGTGDGSGSDGGGREKKGRMSSRNVS